MVDLNNVKSLTYKKDIKSQKMYIASGKLRKGQTYRVRSEVGHTERK